MKNGRFKIRLEKNNLVYSIQRQINEPFFFFVVCHRSTNGNFGREFLMVSLKALSFEINFCLYFNGNNQLARIDNKVNLAGASVVSVIINI